MKNSKFVTLFVLVALFLVSVASVSAGDKVTICHVTPAGEQTFEVSVNAQGHFDDNGRLHGDDYYGECDGRTLPPTPPTCDEGEHLVGETCVPDETDECPAGQQLVNDECVVPDDGEDDEDDDDPVVVDPGTVSTSEPIQPAALQITVWPDNNGQTDNLSGVTWTIDGSPIYDDRNNNGVMDEGEIIVTNIEYRDRPVCGDSGPVVLNQAMSRLVLGTTVDEVGDLDAFLSRFEAEIDGQPVVFGWYDIGGEFAPCVPAFEGAVQQRIGE